MLLNIAISINYTIGWFICILAGREGLELLPIAFTALTTFLFLYQLNKTDKVSYLSTLFLIFYGAILGFILETFFISFDFIKYATVNAVSSRLPPSWIWCLYFLFIPAFTKCFTFLHKHWSTCFLFGLVGGPISYYAGVKLHAASLPMVSYLILLGIGWAIYMSLILIIFRTLNRHAHQVFDQKHLQKPITVLFDGFCSMCSRELKHLKTRRQTGQVHYYSITTKDQFQKDYPHIAFQDAMREIHAIDDNGKIIKGVPVFFELYARTGLPYLAMLSKAPGLTPLIHLLYRLWARFRLTKRKKPF